jgi:hypothetical protein
MLANEDRRRNWRILQEMAGIEPEAAQPPKEAAQPAKPVQATAPVH